MIGFTKSQEKMIGIPNEGNEQKLFVQENIC